MSHRVSGHPDRDTPRAGDPGASAGDRTGFALGGLSDALAAMTRPYDVVSVAGGLTSSCVDAIGASAAGVLITPSPSGTTENGLDLQLLAASSHTAEQLEMYQQMQGEGPAVECLRLGQALTVGKDDVTRRWPGFARLLLALGFSQVHAVPMKWRGSTFGALNVFQLESHPLTEWEEQVCRAYADVCSLAVVHAEHEVGGARLAGEIRGALEGRIVVERAKGVIAEQQDVDRAQAYLLLVALATTTATPLGEAATGVVDRASRGQLWDHNEA